MGSESVVIRRVDSFKSNIISENMSQHEEVVRLNENEEFKEEGMSYKSEIRRVVDFETQSQGTQIFRVKDQDTAS